MTPEVASLNKEPGVSVVGFVENLATVFNHCRISVAPLRYGAGIKGKIGTSLAFGVPCVATPIAAEGMGLMDHREILVADNSECFANAVIEVYKREEMWTRLSRNGLLFMEQNFSFQDGLQRFDNLLKSLSLPPVT